MCIYDTNHMQTCGNWIVNIDSQPRDITYSNQHMFTLQSEPAPHWKPFKMNNENGPQKRAAKGGYDNPVGAKRKKKGGKNVRGYKN